MKFRQASKVVDIPEGVTVTIKSRQVTVKGPRGTLVRDMRHQPMEMDVKNGKIRLTKWTATKSEIACLQTFASHIENMMVGVTRGFRYKMRFVYAHFPINVGVEQAGKMVEVRNFLGEKRVRKVPMRADTKAQISTGVKDEIVLEGNDVEAVSQTAADIHRCAKVLQKDLRMFLDGIYVSEGGAIPATQ
jgi:large subunit ribosomal protein L9e